MTHHWRDVAVNTPRLWTDIKVFGTKNSLDMVEAYLTRSKSIPLDMKVYLTIRSQSTPSVIQAICSHAGRWRRLSVACSASHRELLSLLFRSLHSHSAPLLELVDINAGKLEEDVDPEEASVYDGEDSGNEDANDRFREILTGGSPLLTTIKLCGLHLHNDMPALRMVTTLHIYAPKTPLLCTECCTIFSGLPALTNLWLCNFRLEFLPGSASSVTLPSLLSLHIMSTAAVHADSAFLRILWAPQLTHLLFDDFGHQDMEIIRKIPGWSITSPRYPSLSTLEVNSVGFTLSTWDIIDKYFPTVTNLILSSTDIDYLPDVLGPSSNASSPTDVRWPNLQVFTCNGFELPRDIEPLSVALSTRLATGRPLRKLCFPHPISYTRLDEHLRHAIVQLQQYTEIEGCERTRSHWSNVGKWYNDDGLVPIYWLFVT